MPDGPTPPTDREPRLADLTYAVVELDGPVLTMSGEIDTMVMRAWQREHPSPPSVEVVDATGVTFMNSAALAYLVTLARTIAPERLVVRSQHNAVLLPLRQMGIDALLDVRP